MTKSLTFAKLASFKDGKIEYSITSSFERDGVRLHVFNRARFRVGCICKLLRNSNIHTWSLIIFDEPGKDATELHIAPS